jgi:putative ABC transport system substrate-binding protein
MAHRDTRRCCELTSAFEANRKRVDVPFRPPRSRMTLKRHKLLGISAAHIVAPALRSTVFPVLMERSSGSTVRVTTMNRREIVALLGGAATVWPLAARAQQRERVPRIGVLIGTAADDAIGQARMAAFLQGLGQLDWMVGRNVRMDIRWTAADADQARGSAAELVALAPDVILASSGSVVGPLRRLTRTIPIVFTETSDPVGAGFVESLSRPGGNVTGFLTFEYGLSAKWLELLKQIAPSVTRVAVLRDAAIPSGTGQWGAIQSVAPSFGVELRATDLHDAGEVERSIMAFARSPNSGMILTASAYSLQHRKLIITLALQHKLPTVYFLRGFVADGGLISYGSDTIDLHRRAASYVDRILKGEKPADLPVQAPTKYELVINLKTAKTLGLEVPPILLARADEVIE